MTDDEFVVIRFKQLLDSSGWTVYRLAKETGIPYSSLNNIIQRGTIPSVTLLNRICCGFGISLSQFFDDGDIKIPASKPILTMCEDEVFLVKLYRGLTLRDRKRLIKIANVIKETC